MVLDISLEEYIGTINEKVNYDDYILEKKSESELLNNTGTFCPTSATYGSTRLLSMASAGDLVYEAAGGFGITGHIAIVEGRYWDPVGKRYYIRVVEAISDGVCRGILDDKRYAEKCGYLLKFSSNSGVSFTIKQKAVSFCLGELGKSYGFGSSQSDWYCSELAWTAYSRQNIYIGSKSDGLILPYTMYMSSKTASVNVYK